MQQVSLQNNSIDNHLAKIQNALAGNDEFVLEEEVNLKDTEKALLNILEDYNEEKTKSLNIQRALLNILEDYAAEKTKMENTQRAVLNILEDYGVEKNNMENTQRAVLNILEDYGVEKNNMESTQRAVLNILEDYGVEKGNMENTQRAVLNILEDYGDEKNKVEMINRNLSAANKELESFNYISSHDLQEPLRQIQNFASRIIDIDQQNLSDKGKNYFERMNNAANRMQTLIADLLAYSRTTTMERKFENTDLNIIVEQVQTELKEIIDEKHAIIEVGNMCDAKIIPFQFLQLMHNLIGNALKFSNPNIAPHIKIKSSNLASSKVNNVNLTPQKEYCHISISDNGIGFEPQYKDRIFEVFQRLHDKQKIAGTGIGLAIVKKIVDNHNGIITATSQLNEGATFDIYIPAS